MRFRGLISTSNILDAPEVEITSNEELIWVTEFAEDSRSADGAPAAATGAAKTAAAAAAAAAAAPRGL